MRGRIRLCLVVSLAGVVAGCGSASSGHREVASVATTRPVIVPNENGSSPDSFYVPQTIRVHVGQTVTWTNKDTDPHDVTAEDGSFASGPMAMGGTYRWTFTRPGTYPYFCTIHPEMHGTVIVFR